MSGDNSLPGAAPAAERAQRRRAEAEPFLTRLESGGRPILGTWMKLPAVESTELMALAGFDFLIVDLEHSPISLETAYQIIGMGSALGMAVLVRVPDHGYATIQRMLDAGAVGIIVPHVDNAGEAARAVAAARFPPRGTRGFGSTSRAGAWGMVPAAEYLRRGDDDVLCIPQIESGTAVEAIDEILATDGIRAVFVGPADLAVSLGVAPGDPRATAMTTTVVTRCRSRGIHCGIAVGADPHAAAAAARQEFSFIALSNDASLLGTSALSLVEATRAAHDR